ncbi:MAG: GNAT family N-acetyltransferase [Marinirhabdus sp.]
MKTYEIRPIQKSDNVQVAKVVRSVLTDFGVAKTDTTYTDTALDRMFQTYARPRAAYFVVHNKGTIVGGAGISQLDNNGGDVCELQKMYYLPVARGRGIGREMMQKCLAAATQFGYTAVYLETMTNMTTAQKFYQYFGFKYLDAPMGTTCNNTCPVHMLKKL